MTTLSELRKQAYVDMLNARRRNEAIKYASIRPTPVETLEDIYAKQKAAKAKTAEAPPAQPAQAPA